jgi:hypothetical protein
MNADARGFGGCAAGTATTFDHKGTKAGNFGSKLPK